MAPLIEIVGPAGGGLDKLDQRVRVSASLAGGGFDKLNQRASPADRPSLCPPGRFNERARSNGSGRH